MLDNLRIDGHLEVVDKLHDNAIHLKCQATSGIHNRAEEKIEQNVYPLSLKGNRSTSQDIPAGEVHHLMKHLLVKCLTQPALLKFAPAIEVVNQCGDTVHDQKQEAIQNQFVIVDHLNKIDYQKLHHDIKDAHVGINVHLLMGNETGHKGHLYDTDQHGDARELEYPKGRVHPVGLNVHLVVKKPKADALHQDKKNKRQQTM